MSSNECIESLLNEIENRLKNLKDLSSKEMAPKSISAKKQVKYKRLNKPTERDGTQTTSVGWKINVKQTAIEKLAETLVTTAGVTGKIANRVETVKTLDEIFINLIKDGFTYISEIYFKNINDIPNACRVICELSIKNPKLFIFSTIQVDTDAFILLIVINNEWNYFGDPTSMYWIEIARVLGETVKFIIKNDKYYTRSMVLEFF